MNSVRPFCRLAFVLVLFLAASGRSALAGPLNVPDILRLLESGVGEPVIRAMVGAEGFEGTVGVAEVVFLREAGAADSLLTFLLAQQSGGSGVAGVSVHEEDGVTVVSGNGGESESWVPHSPDEPQSEPEYDQPEEGWGSVGNTTTTTNGWTNPYPSGAAIGPSGSVVFIPAHFGSPSAFGRTIVTTTPVNAWGWGWGSPPVVAWSDPVPEHRTVTIRTSRGPLRVPN